MPGCADRCLGSKPVPQLWAGQNVPLNVSLITPVPGGCLTALLLLPAKLWEQRSPARGCKAAHFPTAPELQQLKVLVENGGFLSRRRVTALPAGPLGLPPHRHPIATRTTLLSSTLVSITQSGKLLRFQDIPFPTQSFPFLPRHWV